MMKLWGLGSFEECAEVLSHGLSPPTSTYPLALVRGAQKGVRQD